MRRTLCILGLIVAALAARADYTTLPIETDEAMGDYTRFECRDWTTNVVETTGLEGGRLAANTTWTGEHVIMNDVYVPSGVTLTIGAGAEVKFGPGTRIKVEDGGAIVLTGEAGNEVVLSGYVDGAAFTGITLQSSSASYSDNSYGVAEGFSFGQFANISISDATTFIAGGQAVVPVNVSGSRSTAFSFDWVAETNGVAFASGTMNWSKVGDGTKSITVPFDSTAFAALSNFTVRATLCRCCNAAKGTATITLSEYITSDIQTDEAMGDYIVFECRDWATNLVTEGTLEGGRLTGNTVWSNEHVIASDVYIPSGVTLTLTADTLVRFCAGTKIKIEDGGILNVVGADGHDVILRGYAADTSYTGVVKMSSGTLTDNSYVEMEGGMLSTFAGVALHDADAFRGSGLVIVPVTVSGSRTSAFSIDWVAETNDAPYTAGTLVWSQVGDGTKNITFNFGNELADITNIHLRVAVPRACWASPATCEVQIREFETLAIETDEAMGDYIAFESRDWTTNLVTEAAVEGGRLTANTTWSGEHVIKSDVYIPSGVTLTLTADTLVRFCAGTMIKIEDGGILNIVGSEGHDVVLRNYDADTTSKGIVKMTSGTYTDNMYVQYPDFAYGNYPNLTLHEANIGRDTGKIYVPITVSGTSRSQSFNVDYETDKGVTGTITWSQSSDGTKWIELPIDQSVYGGTETYQVRLTASRGANIATAKATVTIYEFNQPVTETVAITDGTEESPDFAIRGNIKTQPLFLSASEELRYSGRWQSALAPEEVQSRITLESDNGVTTLGTWSGTEEGSCTLDLTSLNVGHYTLRHIIENATTWEVVRTDTKSFSIADKEDVALHGGTLTSNETWKAGMTHVVYETVTVPSVYTLFIEPGAIVKFMDGTGITLETGAALFANTIVFTSIDDDTIGGDTLSDGFTVAPSMDAYSLSGSFTFGQDTELRYMTQSTALTGTISDSRLLSKGSTYRVSGALTIANGASLTIPAGTVLKMESGASIVVNAGGTLSANGTRAAPITITSINDDSVSGKTTGSSSNPQPGDWKRIYAGGTVNLTFCRIAYCNNNSDNGAIQGTGGTVTLNNCLMEQSVYELVRMNSGSFVAYNSIFRDASMAFGYYGGSGTKCYNCVIADVSEGVRASNKYFYNCIFYRVINFGSTSTYRKCCFYNPPDYLDSAQSFSVCGANGNFWADPLFVDPDNGDFRITEDSPCVDVADNELAPELDYYGQPRITITDQGTNTVQGQLADIGICEVMPRNVTSDIDLEAQSIRAETNAVPGQLLFVKWEVANIGGEPTDAPWRDTISLVSADGSEEVTLGDKTTSSTIAVGGTVFCSGYFTVPAMSEGVWYPKVNVNSYHDIFEGSLTTNNVLIGTGAINVAIATTDTTGASDGVISGGSPKVLKLSFAAADTNRMVRLELPAGVAVRWGFGFVPGSSYSSGSVTTDGKAVFFKVPDGDTDVYLTMESDTTATYNLLTESTQISITSVSPSTLPSSGTVTLTIDGAGFTTTSEVYFVQGTTRIAPASVQYVNDQQLIVSIDCATLTSGTTYDVLVTGDESITTAAGAVSVAAVKGEGKLEAKLILPDSARQGRIITGYIEYSNTGTADMNAPIFIVKGSMSGTRVGLSADTSAMTNAVKLVGISGSYPAGQLKAGETQRLPFYCTVVGSYEVDLAVVDATSSLKRESVFPSWESFTAGVADAATRMVATGGSAGDYDEVVAEATRYACGQTVGVVHGQLLNAWTSLPIANCQLTLLSSNLIAVADAVTDAEGRFRMSDLPTGESFALMAAEVSLESPNASYCAVDAGAACYSVWAYPKARLSLRVRIDGQSLPDGVQVCFANENSGGEVITVVTNETIEVDHLDDGTYMIGSVAGSYYAITNSPTLEIYGGVISSAVDSVAFVPAGVVAVRFWNDEKNVLVTNLNAKLVSGDGSSYRLVRDAADGYLASVPAGQYNLKVGGGFRLAAPVELTVSEGCRQEMTCKVDLMPFTVFPRMGSASLTVRTSLREAGSFSEDAVFSWDFDGDGNADAAGSSATYTYEAPSVYDVELTVAENGETRLYAFTKAVTVYEEPAIVPAADSVVLDDDSGYIVDLYTPTSVVLYVNADSAAVPACIDTGTILIDPEDTLNPRRVTWFGLTGNGEFTALTEAATIQSAYQVYRLSLASSSITAGYRDRGLRIPLDMHFNADIENSSWSINVSPTDGLALYIYLNMSWSKINAFYLGVNGERVTSSVELKDKFFSYTPFNAKNKLGRPPKGKISHMITDVNRPFGVCPVHYEFGPSAEISGSGKFKMAISWFIDAHYCSDKDGSDSDFDWHLDGKDFLDSCAISYAGQISGFAGMEANIGVGAAKTVKGDRTGVTAFDTTVKSGLFMDAKALISNDSFVRDELSLNVGLGFETKTALFRAQSKWLEFTLGTFDWKPPKLKIVNCNLLSPLPRFVISNQETVSDTAVSVNLREYTVRSEFRATSVRWDYDDGSCADSSGASEEPYSVTHVFSGLDPEDYRVFNVRMEENFQHRKNMFYCPGKAAIQKLKFKGLKADTKPPEDEMDSKRGSIPHSVDPNEIVGPAGVGDKETERFVKAGEWMTYTIYYENKTNATAAAQEVTVTNPLSEYLDWSTFEMGEVSFGNQIDLGLSGLQNGTSEVQMNGTNYYVRSQVALDTVNGKVSWYQRIVDKTTDTTWPADVVAGFLPPNDETFRGEGHLTYRIKVRDDVPMGVRIDNAATIVFDYNDPITTEPSWWNRTADIRSVSLSLDGDETVTNLTLIAGKAFGELPTPSRKNYSFKGWYLDASCAGEAITSETVVPSGLSSLHAKWQLDGAVFETDALVVNEGSNLVLRVLGGNASKAASVKVYLAYQTASAADLSLKKGKVDAVTPKGGLSFPLTLAWAAGEIGTKTITIPVLKDTAVENDETLAFQLASPKNMALGASTVAHVTLHDPSRDALAARIGAGKASKTEKKTWKTLAAAAAKPYVGALVTPAYAGKVTGAGRFAKGAKAKLKATANKGYVFSGWYAADPSGGEGLAALPLTRANSYAVTVAEADVTLYAKFITAASDVAAISFGLPAELTNGVTMATVPVDVSGCTSLATVKVTGLPTGLTFASNKIYGKPVKSGFFTITATATTAGKKTAKATQKVVVRKAAETVLRVSVPKVDGKTPGAATGTGVYARNKKVTLKATAAKGYVFSGWYAGGIEGGTLLSRAASYVLTVPAADLAVEALFLTAAEDKAGIAATVNGVVLDAESPTLATNVWAGVYVKIPVVPGGLSAATAKVTGLPKGLSFASNKICGAPSVASAAGYAVKVTVTTAGKNARTFTLRLVVDALPAWVRGTFTGPSYSGLATNGLATVTVATTGAISAKHPVGTTAASFAASCFTAYDPESGTFAAKLTAKVGKKTVTDTLLVGYTTYETEDAAGATVTVTNGIVEAGLFDAYQYDWKAAPWKALGASVAAMPSYTYVTEDGAGTVTLKFASSGAVTVTGVFKKTVKGKTTTVKATGSTVLVPVDGGYLAFVYLAPKGFAPHARTVTLPDAAEWGL